MSSFVIEGGHKLSGEVIPQGAKNEALQILSSVLLTPGEVEIDNLPDIIDVNKLIDLLRSMGVKTRKLGPGKWWFQADDINLDFLKSDEFKNKGSSLRGSVMILGPLLTRYGIGALPRPGGDKIGRRRMDTTFLGFKSLGAEFEYNSATGFFTASVPGGKLKGTSMLLDEASVTGTANVVMAAVMAEGTTTIYKDVKYDELGVIPRIFKRMGVKLERRGDDIYVPAQDSYEIEKFIDGSILTVSDAPWPGFTPDLLSIVLVMATQAKGSVLIHQKMFESRLFFVDKLIDMGAQIILCDPHRATVNGLDHQSPLRGVTMTSPDIRAGVSLLIAALSAEGTSTIHNIGQIDRGYQNIDERLRKLGARITRID